MRPGPSVTSRSHDRDVMKVLVAQHLWNRTAACSAQEIGTSEAWVYEKSLLSNQTNLISFYEEVSYRLDHGESLDVVYLDFSKAFDTVPHKSSVATLTECMRNKVLAKFFRERQEMLKHSLPLGSYLLKPVQRILKYHLLLQEIAKHFDIDKEGYEVVEEAIETMTGVAWYINDMKRKHEHAVRQQEIQSLLLNWNGQDLTTYGELVLEGTFRVQRARSDRTFFLFDKVLLITKKRGDHYIYKTHIPCSHLMLIESTRDSICFTLTHYKNSKQQHNVQAKTVEEKRLWTHHIKKLILENHHAIIPQKAKEAILEMDAVYPGRYRYSPERVKKTMSAIDPMISHLSGRRQSGMMHVPTDPVLQPFFSFTMEITLEKVQILC
ncbi:unnamed protein product [Ranitomeya imitator]|uniref:Uncharacterized protein n=1 Tax=Ranitomeya imitator TaxID=111125 RepID=A0ABN9KUA2_9NEOB|nr:unnamed protein product [Ranitomeya imitator]